MRFIKLNTQIYMVSVVLNWEWRLIGVIPHEDNFNMNKIFRYDMI